MSLFQTLFESSPDACLAVQAEPAFTIVAVTNAYLAATMTTREAIVGRPLFEVFPDNPAISDSASVRSLRASLERVIATGEPQGIPPIQYDIRRPADRGSEFEQRFWRVRNLPVRSADGRVEVIMHCVEDVTALMQLEQSQREQNQANESLRVRIERAAGEVRSREQELEFIHRELADKQHRLRESEARLNVATMAGEVATWIWEPATDQLYADETLRRWFHVPPEGSAGGALELFLSAVNPSDLPRVRAAIEHTRNTHTNMEVEYRVRLEGGGWRHLLTRSWTELDPDSGVTRLAGVVLDLTQLRHATEALEETRELLHLAADAAEIGSFTYRIAPGTLSCSPRCKEHFAVRSDESVSVELLYSRIHEEDRDHARAVIDDALAQGTAFDAEARVVAPDGTIRWIRAKGRSYYDASHQTTRLDGITLDVSRQRKVEAELQQSEARYRLVVDSLPDYAIFLLDDDGRVTHWNAGAERLLGYSADEILGQPGAILFTPEDRARGDPEKEIATAKADGSANDDRWHMRKDGTRLFVTGLMSSLKDDRGRRIGLTKIMRDITDLQAAAAEREQLLESERMARAEAERTSRLKDEFLATLSHELRTPLNAIVGWTQVLKTPELEPGDVAQGLDVIERNARVQTRLIEDLLDMSRIISGKVRLEVQPVAIANVVNAAIDSVRTAAEAKGLHLTAVYHGASGTVTGDPNRLQQVVWNLLSNAIKFSPPRGRVQISVARTDAAMTVSVTDNGMGISADFLPHVFERFRQADASTTRQHGGLGLGLSIVKQLVELHGGEVRAESAGLGRGSTFSFTIPLIAAVPLDQPMILRPLPSAGGAPATQVDLRGIKALVVDDEPDSGGLVKRVLAACGAEVQIARSVDEALQVFPAFAPHVLLSDIGMPGHDGYELIRRLREVPEGRTLPAAALTALARGEDRSRALEAGFNAHVAKPVEPAALIAVVAALTGRRPTPTPGPETIAREPSDRSN